MAEEIPFDVIFEILTRLPAKTLCRCRCLSRRWNATIGGNRFLAAYIARTSPSWVIVEHDHPISLSESLYQYEWPLPPTVSSIPVNFQCFGENFMNLVVNENLFSTSPITLLQSSQGFLLLSVEMQSKSLGLVSKELFVVNPLTHDWFWLTQKPPQELFSPHHLGFVAQVCDRTGVFEQFVVVDNLQDSLMRYSSVTGTWEVKPAQFPINKDRRRWALEYYFDFDGRLICNAISNKMLICWDHPFDNNTDHVAFRCITLPVGFADDALYAEWFVSAEGGHIQCVQVYDQDLLTLWRLVDYHNGVWSLLFRFSFIDIWSERAFLTYGLDVRAKPIPCCVHPFDPDVGIFMAKFPVNHVFCANLRARDIDSCAASNMVLEEYSHLIPIKLPNSPSFFSPTLKATSLKELGNKYLEAQNFSKAISCYSRSISLNPNTLAYLSRAMVYFKFKRYRKAEVDCTEAIKIDDLNFSAFRLRARTRLELDNLSGFIEDVEAALKLKPEDQEMMTIHAEAKAFIEKATGAKE